MICLNFTYSAKVKTLLVRFTSFYLSWIGEIRATASLKRGDSDTDC